MMQSNTDIRILTQDDEELLAELIEVFEEVFEMDSLVIPDVSYLHNLLAKESFMAVVATKRLDGKDKSRVVGGLSVYVLPQYYSTQPYAYIFDLAVLPKYQRQGIGRALIEKVREYAHIHNFEEVFVQADYGDRAVEFYRAINPSGEERAIHFSYAVKK